MKKKAPTTSSELGPVPGVLKVTPEAAKNRRLSQVVSCVTYKLGSFNPMKSFEFKRLHYFDNILTPFSLKHVGNPNSKDPTWTVLTANAHSMNRHGR